MNEKLLSDSTRLRILNVCHANVASLFALMTNKDNRGSAFAWAGFPALAAKRVPEWLLVHLPRLRKDALAVSFAENVTKAIAENLVRLAGLEDK